MLSKRFQVTLLKLLLDHKLNNLSEIRDQCQLPDAIEIDYLLFPATPRNLRPAVIDWGSVTSVLFSCEKFRRDHINCYSSKANSRIHTKSGLVCTCMIKNSLVYTPHNGHAYYITGILNDMNGNSLLKLRNKSVITYKKYYEVKYALLSFSTSCLCENFI